MAKVRIIFEISIGFAVFVFVLVVKHGQIRLVAALRNEVVLYRLEYCTARLVRVRTVRETALLRELEDFLEIACEFFTLHVESTKAFDAWCVNEPTVRDER